MKPVFLLILGLGLAYFFKGLADNEEGGMQTYWYIIAGGFALAGVVSFIQGFWKKDEAVLIVVEDNSPSWDQKLISGLIRICIVVVILIVLYGVYRNTLGG